MTVALDTVLLTEQVIKTRQRLTQAINKYEFLNKGGMAFADHKGETVRAYVSCIHVFEELIYFEQLADLPISSINVIPECKYMVREQA